MTTIFCRISVAPEPIPSTREEIVLRHRLGATSMLLFVLVLSFWFTLGCNSGSKSLSNGPQGPGGTSGGGLIGAGSTFIYPAMTRWIEAFQSAHPGVQINYQSIGSGGGIQQLKKGLVDFGASDAALEDEQLRDMPPLVQIPESAGPVCITFNLPELKSPLKLSASTWREFTWARSRPGRTRRLRRIIPAYLFLTITSSWRIVRTEAARRISSPSTSAQ